MGDTESWQGDVSQGPMTPPPRPGGGAGVSAATTKRRAALQTGVTAAVVAEVVGEPHAGASIRCRGILPSQ